MGGLRVCEVEYGGLRFLALVRANPPPLLVYEKAHIMYTEDEYTPMRHQSSSNSMGQLSGPYESPDFTTTTTTKASDTTTNRNGRTRYSSLARDSLRE